MPPTDQPPPVPQDVYDAAMRVMLGERIPRDIAAVSDHFGRDLPIVLAGVVIKRAISQGISRVCEG